MQGIPSDGKRSRSPEDSEDLPSSKRQKIHHDAKRDELALMEFADFTSEQLIQDCIAARESILKLTRDNPESVDLSWLSAATLAALPSGTLGSALSAIKYLILPENIYSLPAICSEMPVLQELILRGYVGHRLDLLPWPRLQQVSGSVSVTTEEIYVHSPVDVSLTTPRMTKLRCYRMTDSGQFRVHALPGQSYYKTLRGRNEPDLQSMNASANFAGTEIPIVCRHIAAYVLPHLQRKDTATQLENGYLGISDLNDLPKKISQELDRHFFAYIQSSRTYHCVSDSRFGLWATEQFKDLQNAAQKDSSGNKESLSKSYFALSSNHSFVLVLRYKPNSNEHFVKIMMDPNQTLTHTRRSEYWLHKVQYTNFLSLIPTELHHLYFFPDTVPSLLLVDTDIRAEGESPQVNWAFFDQGVENFFPIFLACGISEGVESFGVWLRKIYTDAKQNAQPVFNILKAAYLNTGLFAIEQAVAQGHTDTTKAYLKLIEDFLMWHSTLNPHDVGNQLPDDAWRTLILPLHNLVQMYKLTIASSRPALRAIVESTGQMYSRKLISSEACLNLLQDQFDHHNLMEAALLNNDEETVRCTGKLLCQLVSRAAIDLDQCIKILDHTIGDPGATTELLSWRVLRNCLPSMMDTYTDLLVKLREAILDMPFDEGNDLHRLSFLVWLNADEELIMPLLFRGADVNDSINTLRRRGDNQLAERLLKLAGPDRPAHTKDFEFRFNDFDG